jgi:hypothetical protein
MAEARGRDEWARTSALMALIANVNRDPRKSRPFKPSDFDPYAGKRTEAVVVDKGNIGLLKEAFLRPKGAERERRSG